MEQTAKVTLDQQIDKYLIDVKDALTKAIGAEKTDKIFTDAAAYKIEWPVPEQEICNCNGELADDAWLIKTFGTNLDIHFMDDEIMRTVAQLIKLDSTTDDDASKIFPKWKEALSFMLALEMAYKALALAEDNN